MKLMQFMKPLIVINIFIIITTNFLMPLWATFVITIGGDLRTAGIAICIFSIVTGLFMLAGSWVQHRLKRDGLLLVLTSFLFTITFFGYFFITAPWQLYLIQVILGLCSAFHTPALYSLYHRTIPSTHSGFYWGIWNSIFFITIGIGALTSAYIAHHFGFTMVFIVMVGLSTIGNIYTVLVVQSIKKFNTISKTII